MRIVDTSPATYRRRFPVGAEFGPANTVHFRVWVPTHRNVAVVVGDHTALTLHADGDGYHAISLQDVPAGTRYRYRLGTVLLPDPASRFQPDGPHGPSQLVDPTAFPWTDGSWPGISLAGQVLYEMHVGTFTPTGTWASAAAEIPALADVGVTCLEVMPVAEFPGRFGWGYDGVCPFAPTHLYGTPDDFRRFVDVAHGHGLGVILDVVYNHLGPDGNYLGQFADAYFTDRYTTDWGRAINFDGPGSGPVREYFFANAAYWIEEFHLDGLRLDATQNIYDDSPPDRHVLTEIGRAVRAAAKGRATVVVNENESQHAELCRPIDRGGHGLDGLWNDDFHHAATVALTGRSEAYYSDYRGTPQELISAIKYGFLYQGQWYAWQKQRRGRPGFDLPPAAFVTFLQNHDQVANSGQGRRVHDLTSPGRYRAMTAYFLLAPGTPMLFQGQEFAASTPFLFFADHAPELAATVRAGRAKFLSQFRSLADPEAVHGFPAPDDERAFSRCILNFAERETHAAAYRLTKDLLRLRRDVPAFRGTDRGRFDGAVLGDAAFALRFFPPGGEDRLLVVNLGRDLHSHSCPEPLLAPPAGMRWVVELSTEAVRYGGHGTYDPETMAEGWRIPGEAAVLLRPESPETGAT